MAAVAAITGILALAGPVGAQSISPPLYDQTASTITNADVSQDFETSNNAYDNQGADDFVVPAGKTWTITQVEVDGQYFNGPGPAASVNVTFYADASGVPGTAVRTFANLPYSNGPNFTIPLPSSVVLAPGHYWLSVQSRQDFTPAGEWGWDGNAVQTRSAAAFQNPGNGFGTGCTTWRARATTCSIDANDPDNSFRLRGTDGPVVVDTTGPTCVVTQTTTTLPKKQTVRVADAGSGLASIGGVVITNGTTAIPTFAPGAPSADVVTTKQDQSKRTVYSFTATDVAGNSTLCR